MTTNHLNIVELAFPLLGSEIEADHGYTLYSAVSHVIADAHGADWIGIHTLRGKKTRPGYIRIGESETLRLRLPAEKIPILYKLSGKQLRLGNSSLRCGIPTVRLLSSSENLRARLVVIKTAHEPKIVEPGNFLKSLRRKLMELNITGVANIENYNDSQARRVMTIKDKIIVGYGVVITELNQKDSLTIQAVGIGGRRRMGCGLFEPIQAVKSIEGISL